MDTIRDLINSLGLQAEHFDTLIIAVVVVGSVLAIRRLYQDLTGPVIELYQHEEKVQ